MINQNIDINKTILNQVTSFYLYQVLVRVKDNYLKNFYNSSKYKRLQKINEF